MLFTINEQYRFKEKEFGVFPCPPRVMLPQHFSAHGYRTESLGKVFHIGHTNEGDPQSFSVSHFKDKVIDELDRLRLTDNTIIVFWSDHGFHPGDHGIWIKHTNYEQANRIPLLITAPGVTKPNTTTKQIAESVDIYPTLAELVGLPAPRGPQSIDGVSLVPVLRDPAMRVRDHAFHAFPKEKLGRVIRNARYRLVEWKTPGKSAETAEIELYDYESDPLETKNLATEQPEVVKELRMLLAKYPEAVSKP